MSQDDLTVFHEKMRTANLGGPHRMVLLGLLIISISIAVWFAANYYAVKGELQEAKSELQTTRLELKDIRQHLEAQRVINKRQAEMLRAAMESQKTP